MKHEVSQKWSSRFVLTRALPTLYTDGEYIRSAWCHLARTSYTAGLEGL